MKVFKSEFSRALKFASLASDFGNLRYDDHKLKITAIHYDYTFAHEVTIGVADVYNPDLDVYINLQRILPLLNAFNKVIDLSATENKLILADDTLTYEVLLINQLESPTISKIRNHGTIRFHSLDVPELKMFFKLAKTVSDFIEIKVNGTAILKTKTIQSESEDEVQLRVMDCTGEAQSTYHTEHLAKISQFLKNKVTINIENDGPLVLESGHDTEKYKLQLSNVDGRSEYERIH